MSESIGNLDDPLDGGAATAAHRTGAAHVHDLTSKEQKAATRVKLDLKEETEELAGEHAPPSPGSDLDHAPSSARARRPSDPPRAQNTAHDAERPQLEHTETDRMNAAAIPLKPAAPATRPRAAPHVSELHWTQVLRAKGDSSIFTATTVVDLAPIRAEFKKRRICVNFQIGVCEGGHGCAGGTFHRTLTDDEMPPSNEAGEHRVMVSFSLLPTLTRRTPDVPGDISGTGDGGAAGRGAHSATVEIASSDEEEVEAELEPPDSNREPARIPHPTLPGS
jgi:hypothetical protein